MKNQKPNSRSRADTPNKSKPMVPDRERRPQNPPEIIVLPDSKPNIEPTKPVEKPSEDKPSGEKPSDKK